MNILVFIKQVLDTAAKIEIENDQVATKNIPLIVNPYDEFAIEEAIRIKEKRKDVNVTLINLGSEKSSSVLRTGLSMGADNAIHIMDPVLENIDHLAVAMVLAQVAKTLPHDLIFCGRQAVDDDMGQVGPAIAIFLGLPYVSLVTKLELVPNSSEALITRQIEGGSEIIETKLPVLLTCQKGLNEPRLPSLKGIMNAKKKKIQILDCVKLGLDLSILAKSRKIPPKLTLPPERKKGTILDGSAKEAASRLAYILRNDLKVI